jgi:hypothetical protein
MSQYKVTPNGKSGDGGEKDGVEELHSSMFLLVEDPTSSTKAHRIADFLTASVILSIVVFCLSTEKTVESVCGYECFLALDLVFVAIFTVEFVVRLYVYKHDTIATTGDFWSDPLNWIDLVAIIPSYIELLIWGAVHNFVAGGGEEIVALRIMKLCKVFRVFKLMKHFDGTDVLIKTIWDSLDALSIPFFFLILFNLLFASFMFNIETQDPLLIDGSIMLGNNETGYEPATYETILHTIYFMFVTMTTTGYGDQYPITTLGRMLCAIAAIFGILFLAMPLSIVGASFYNNWNAYLKKQQEAADVIKAKNDRDEYISKTAKARGVSEEVILKETQEKKKEEVEALVVPKRLTGFQRDIMTTYFQCSVNLSKLLEKTRALEAYLKQPAEKITEEEFMGKARELKDEFFSANVLCAALRSIISRAHKAKGLSLLRRASNKVMLDIKMRRWASMYGRDGTKHGCEVAEKHERGWKDGVYLMLEVPESSKAAKRLSHLSILIILSSVVVFILESDLNYHGENGLSKLAWFILETFFTVVFSVEFVLRAMVTPDRPMFWKDTLNWFDLVAIIPFYIELLIALASGTLPWNVQTKGAVGQALKLVKLCRVLRVFKMTRQFPGSRLLYKTAVFSAKALTVPMFFLLVFVLLFAAMLFYLEPGVWVLDPKTNSTEIYVYPDGTENNFSSIFSTFWVIIITITTVGYGDQYPNTGGGRIVCLCAMIFGILYTAMPLTIVGSYFFDAYEAQQKALANPQAVTEELDKLLTPRAKEKCQVFQSKGKAYMFSMKENVLKLFPAKEKRSSFASISVMKVQEQQNAAKAETVEEEKSKTLFTSIENHLKCVEACSKDLEKLQSVVFDLMEGVQCLSTSFPNRLKSK